MGAVTAFYPRLPIGQKNKMILGYEIWKKKMAMSFDVIFVECNAPPPAP